MKRALTALSLVLTVLGAACSSERQNVLAPTSTTNAGNGGTTTGGNSGTSTGNSNSTAGPLTGTWSSSAIPSPSTCGNLQWQVTQQSGTYISGTFSAVCGTVSISGTAGGPISGTTVSVSVLGSASMAGASCSFTLSVLGTVVGADTINVQYSGTTCLGPVHGSETLKKKAATAPPPTTPTPAPAPAPSAPPDPLFGCGVLVNNKTDLVSCIHAGINPHDADSSFEVTKRVAWALRGEGGGLLIKNGGENVVIWQGRSFAAGRICYPDGHVYKVITDVGAGGANGPGWQDNDFVDRSLYVSAIDPTLR